MHSSVVMTTNQVITSSYTDTHTSTPANVSMYYVRLFWSFGKLRDVNREFAFTRSTLRFSGDFGIHWAGENFVPKHSKACSNHMFTMRHVRRQVKTRCRFQFTWFFFYCLSIELEMRTQWEKTTTCENVCMHVDSELLESMARYFAACEYKMCVTINQTDVKIEKACLSIHLRD